MTDHKNYRGEGSGQAIFAADLSKKFGHLTALDALDLQVGVGEIHGFLGPNGSGKSTTIRILLGLLRKNSGQVRLLGRDPWLEAVALHKRLAYIPGEVNLWPNLTGGEAIDLICKLRGGCDEKARQDLLHKFDLDPTKKFRTYSKGNRQKVAIVAALASNVELYIFDEPTSGLDPLMEAAFQDCVRELKNNGKTVFLSSHILSEVAALCDHVSIIRKGSIIKSGTLDDLRQMTHTNIQAVTSQPVQGLDKISGVHNLKSNGNQVAFDVEPADLNAALQAVTRHDVKSLICQPPGLEELFKSYYTETAEK
jgi:ABC-2 type transport system ATP-binding protein